MEKEKDNPNSEKNFLLYSDTIKNMTQAGFRYQRDFLLELRLHPLSLKMPEDLPNVEIIKEQLILHLNDSSSAPRDKYDLNNYYFPPKSEFCNIKNDWPLLSPCLNRMLPYCFPPHTYNGAFSNSSAKFRSPFTYCNPLKKHPIANHPCYKELGIDESLWTKPCYAPDDIWTCYPVHPHASFSKKTEGIEGVPKNRKKLQIIDPITGKNVLEGDIERINEHQSSDFNVNEDSESGNCNSVSTENKYEGYFCGDVSEEAMHGSSESYQDTVCSSDNKVFCNKPKYNATCVKSSGLTNEDDLKVPSKTNDSTLSSSIGDNGVNLHSRPKNAAEHSILEDSTDKISNCTSKVHEKCDVPDVLNRQTFKVSQNKEPNHPPDVHGICHSQLKKEVNAAMCKETTPKQNEGLVQLRDKIYSLKQEQQKMAIMQSFLRYKKYQLEESARNLDEKRIEIANWECNLYNKCKRLQDKEQWLENRNEMLYNKAIELAEREKRINIEEKKLNDRQPSRNLSKLTSLSEKRYSFDNYDDITWENGHGKGKSNRDKELIDSECTYIDQRPIQNNQSSSMNVAECKYVMSSLDELEKNIVLIEKTHTSKQVGADSAENISDSFSSPALNKSENGSSEPLGPSKGRRYLPEHIKYWLNKREKSSL